MTKSLNQAFGTILAAYRQLQQLSQEDFEGAAHRTYISDLERGLKSPTLETISKLADRLQVHPTELIAQTFSLLETSKTPTLRSGIKYRRNNSKTADFSYTNTGNKFTPEEVEKTVILTNKTVVSLATIFQQVAGIDLFEVIDKKQTGAFIGAIFVSNMAEIASNNLAVNPSQTGHPDLVPKEYLKDTSISNWDQFLYGGVEVKTSCGNLKTGVTKTLAIGNARISHLTGIDWKGHHQYINNLLALFWDYFDDRPTIMSAFYSNRLVPKDFSNTVPKQGGGRTTSVCVTKKTAREKLTSNWVLLPEISAYLDFLKKLGVDC
ncbi:MAG: helix-turn-helix transcriptional regulator [Cyanobacteriota bacterium]|nr:helix-turn-helix transcriptional regulator [Cyanobacteriota bacterium]